VNSRTKTHLASWDASDPILENQQALAAGGGAGGGGEKMPAETMEFRGNGKTKVSSQKGF